MKPKTTATPTRKISHVMVPLPSALRERVEVIAKDEDRSMAAICRRFITEGLDRLDEPQPQTHVANT